MYGLAENKAVALFSDQFVVPLSASLRAVK